MSAELFTKPKLTIVQNDLHPLKATKTAARRKRRIEKRVLFTDEETTELLEMLRNMSKAAGVEITFSHCVRALIRMIEETKPELAAQLKAYPPIRRPANGSELNLVEFELHLARLIVDTLSKHPKSEHQKRSSD